MIAMVLSIGIVFGIVASIMAFLITYEEYVHHYIGRQEPLRASFQTALFAFIVFVALSLIVGWLFSHVSLMP